MRVQRGGWEAWLYRGDSCRVEEQIKEQYGVNKRLYLSPFLDQSSVTVTQIQEATAAANSEAAGTVQFVNVDSGGSGEENLHRIRSSPHFHTCAHLARTQVWLSACRLGKVTIIGRLGPTLSTHLRGAFHHFQSVQTALLKERTVASTQRTSRRAIAHTLRHTFG